MSNHPGSADNCSPDSCPPAAPEGSCCDPLAVRALTAEQAAQIAPMFKALGDPVRLRLMSMIASQPEVCVCDLTGAFEVSGPTISHHLRVLRESGLVDNERRATWVYYRVLPEAVQRLSALLDTAPATHPEPEPAQDRHHDLTRGPGTADRP